MDAVRRQRWLTTGGLGALILALLGGGLALGIYKHAAGKIEGTNNPDLDLTPSKGPMNVLVVGSDSREGLTPQEQRLRQYRPTDGRRSDTLILVHLFGDGKHAVVLSFPRDLRVDVPGAGIGKINSAYNFGPQRVVDTVEQYTGLTINHYVEVNFASFRKIVDALGGVRLCVTRPYKDPKAGLNLEKRGCYDFDGDMSLAWARSRSVEPDGDFGRIRRQQQLIRVMLQKVTSIRLLLNPARAVAVINRVSEGLETDANFTLSVARGLAGRLRNARESNPNVDFRMVPSFPKNINGVSYVVARDNEAQALFDAIKADTWPLPPFGKTSFSIPSREDVTVRVVDASGKPGVASSIKDLLDKAGYRVLRTVRKADPLEKTIIYYRPGDELKARLLGDEFPEADVVSGDRADPTADVTIFVGADADMGGG